MRFILNFVTRSSSCHTLRGRISIGSNGGGGPSLPAAWIGTFAAPDPSCGSSGPGTGGPSDAMSILAAPAAIPAGVPEAAATAAVTPAAVASGCTASFFMNCIVASSGDGSELTESVGDSSGLGSGIGFSAAVSAASAARAGHATASVQRRRFQEEIPRRNSKKQRKRSRAQELYSPSASASAWRDACTASAFTAAASAAALSASAWSGRTRTHGVQTVVQTDAHARPSLKRAR